MQPNDQIPSQVPPDPTLPPAQPVRRTVIQPISSEDEIRQAAASSGAPARPSEPGVNPVSVNPSGATSTGSPEYENTYQGSLVTEPVHRPGEVPLQYNKPQIPAPGIAATAKTKKPVAKVIVVTLLIAILGAAAWFFFFNRVSSADLVQESVEESTYLRPKQWLQTSPSVSAYSNKTEQAGESTTFVSVSEFPLESSQISTGTEESYDRYRKLIMGQFSDNVLALMISVNAPIDCPAARLELTDVEEDTDKNKTTIGLIRVSASCEQGGDTITIKMRLVAGMNDERVRMVIVGGTALDWIKSGDALQHMLDGVEERAAVTQAS